MDIQPLLGADVQVTAIALDLSDVCEVTCQNAPQDCLLLVEGGPQFVDLFGDGLAKFELHLLFSGLESIETLDLRKELVVDLQGLFHGSMAQLVLSADALSIVCVCVVEAEEEINESQEISLLRSYLFLGLQDAEAVASEELALDLQHADQHEDFLGAAELGIEGVH